MQRGDRITREIARQCHGDDIGGAGTVASNRPISDRASVLSAALFVALCAPPPAAVDDDAPLRVVDRAPPVSAGSRTVDPLLIANKTRRTAEDLLELVPGLYVVQHGSEGKGHQFYLRGFDALHGADVEVRVGGVPINEHSNIHGHGYVDLGFVIPELVAGVEAHKGASDVRQGDFATAGTVALALGVPAALRGERLVYEVGTTGRHRVAAVFAPRGAREGTAAAVEVVDDPGFGVNRANRRAAALGQWEGALGEGTFTGWVGLYHSDFGLPSALRLYDIEAGRIALDGSYTDDTDGTSQRAIGAARWQRRMGRWRFAVAAFGGARRLRLEQDFTGWFADPIAGDRHRQTHQAVGGGGQVELGWTPRAALRVDVVADARGEGFSQAQVPVADDDRHRDPTRSLGGLWHRQGIAAAARWRPWSWLLVEGGARLDAWRFDVDDAVNGAGEDTIWAASPRAQARVALGDWMFFAAAGRGIRPPEARAVTRLPPMADAPQDVYEGGDAAVTAGDTVEAGARWSPGDVFTASAAVFWIGIDREQLYDHVSATNVERGATRRRGVEAGLVARPWPWLSLALDATVVDATFANGDDIPGVPPVLVRFDGAAEHPSGWRGGVGAMALAARPLGDGAQAAAVAVVDASVGHRWPRVALDLAVENALGADWREGEYRFASWWDRSRPRSALPVIHVFAGASRQARLTLTGWF